MYVRARMHMFLFAHLIWKWNSGIHVFFYVRTRSQGRLANPSHTGFYSTLGPQIMQCPRTLTVNLYHFKYFLYAPFSIWFVLVLPL